MNKILKAYVDMILNGDAFSNWKIKPSSYVRSKTVEILLELKNNDMKKFNFAIESIQEVDSDIELYKLLNEWEIKEEEFKV